MHSKSHFLATLIEKNDYFSLSYINRARTGRAYGSLTVDLQRQNTYHSHSICLLLTTALREYKALAQKREGADEETTGKQIQCGSTGHRSRRTKMGSHKPVLPVRTFPDADAAWALAALQGCMHGYLFSYWVCFTFYQFILLTAVVTGIQTVQLFTSIF